MVVESKANELGHNGWLRTLYTVECAAIDASANIGEQGAGIKQGIAVAAAN
jgi:hypothetical protein